MPASSPAPACTPARRRRNALPGAVAALALALGYADLARGGTTAAAALLVLGYCALVPAAILAGTARGGR